MSNNLEEKSRQLRAMILKMFYASGAGHLAPALSSVDILTVLYFGGLIDLGNFDRPDRDRVILSKGPGASAALYAVLSELGHIPREELLTFCRRGSRLLAFGSSYLPGFEMSGGSLGHGLCFATGTAKVAKLDCRSYWTFVVMGDGEAQEGSIWEAALFAANQKLDNLVCIMDRNRMQACDWVAQVAEIEPVADKWRSFGWRVEEVDGHDVTAMKDLFVAIKKQPDGRPTVVIAHTVKGKGLSAAEGDPSWHTRVPQGDSEWERAFRDLGLVLNDIEAI